MPGLNRETGHQIGGWEHVWQSIQIILSTPLGTRVMRRDFGSLVPDLIDRPSGLDTVLEVTLALADALEKWEPRFRLKQVQMLSASQDGRHEFRITGLYYPRGHLGDYSVVEDAYGTTVVARAA